MILFNLKLASRNLAKNKVYSFLIIGGFAIGFAACILIGLFYHTETNVNKDFANHKQLYRLYDVKKNHCNLNWDMFPILKQDYAVVKDACPLDYATGKKFIIKNEAGHTYTEIKHLLTTTNNFFSMFSVDLLETSGSKPFYGKESMLLSKAVAQKLFGSQNPLGHQVNLDNNWVGTVTGIFNELPKNSSFQADIIMNSENEKFRLNRTISNGKRYNPTNHFVVLRKGTNPEAFANEINKSATIKSLDIDTLSLQALDDIYLSKLTIKSRHAKGNPGLLKIFLAIAILIILLSSINYLNYSISMQYAKLKSIGINKTNGAKWQNMINYTLVEVTLGIIISLILSAFITLMALPYTEKLFGKQLHIGWQDLSSVLPIFLTAVVMVILMNCFAPIYVLSKFKITEFLSGYRGKRNGKQLGRQAMLTFQLTVSIALIAVVMVIFKQLNFVKYSDPGFGREMLVRIDIPDNFGKTDVLIQEIGKLPFVKSSSISQGCPGMINNRMGSNTGKNNFDINVIPVGKDYLKTMNIELVKGRDLMDCDLKKACLLNEEALKQFGWDSFEDKKYNNGIDYNVVGIVKDFKFESYYKAVEPLALIFNGAPNANILSVRLTSGNISQNISKIRQMWKTLFPYDPMNFMFYDDFFQSMYAKEEKLASSITFFSIIAIVLTCMGLLGQIFMICLNRIKEIGIRKINGASISEVIVILNRDFVQLIAFAFVIASPIAWYAMHKWLQNFAYKTELSWWVFALAGIVAVAVAVLTVSWQSWRAATRNPVEALRYE